MHLRRRHHRQLHRHRPPGHRHLHGTDRQPDQRLPLPRLRDRHRDVRLRRGLTPRTGPARRHPGRSSPRAPGGPPAGGTVVRIPDAPQFVACISTAVHIPRLGRWKPFSVTCGKVGSTRSVNPIANCSSGPAQVRRRQCGGSSPRRETPLPGGPIKRTAASGDVRERPQLSDSPGLRLDPPHVWVTENPTVLALAVRRLGERCPPLVCSSGWPNSAVVRLLRAAGRSGARIRRRAA
ncbi:DUF2399 domain-containing protein [Actinomadura sp. KC345]|nr:DUF2399 domain-containing protein [Actinomadura sp. KC345]